MESTDSGQGDDFHIALSFAFHFIYQGSHAIDTCIARTDDADCFALFGVFESLFGTNPFALHSGVDTFGIRTDKVTDKTKIILVSHHYICFTHGSEHRRGNILFTSRPDAGYDYLGLFHNLSVLSIIHHRGHRVLIFGLYGCLRERYSLRPLCPLW